jgi:uncharacterized phage protein (TIGR01671 family)
MREIKFRAWNSIDKEMMYGVWLSSDGSVIDFEYGNVVGTYPKDKVIPLQYTGLKDRNGTEIYEGDIIEIRDLDGYIGIHVVDFDYGEYVAGYFRLRLTAHRGIVIGNIYENPELLKGETK